MVLAIALGIGASMTTLTVLHVMSGDPIPQKSGSCSTCSSIRAGMRRLHAGRGARRPDDALRRRGAAARAAAATRQAMMTGGSVGDRAAARGHRCRSTPTRATPRADFFPMFDAPFLYGTAGSAPRTTSTRARRGDRQRAQREAVRRRQQRRQDAARRTSTTSASSACSTTGGRRRGSTTCTNDRFGELEQVFVPFTTSRDLEHGPQRQHGLLGRPQDRRSGRQHRRQCAVHLDPVLGAARHAGARPRRTSSYLDNYSDQQRAAAASSARPTCACAT